MIIKRKKKERQKYRDWRKTNTDNKPNLPKKEIIKPTTKVDVFYLLFHIWYNGWPKKYIWYNDMISQIKKKEIKLIF